MPRCGFRPQRSSTRGDGQPARRRTPRGGTGLLLGLWMALFLVQVQAQDLRYARIDELEEAFQAAIDPRADREGPDLVAVGRALLLSRETNLEGLPLGEVLLARNFHKLPARVRQDLAPEVAEHGETVGMMFSLAAQLGKGRAELDATLRAAALVMLQRFEADASYQRAVTQEVLTPSRFAEAGLAFVLRYGDGLAGAVLDVAFEVRDDVLLETALRRSRSGVFVGYRIDALIELIADPARPLMLRQLGVLTFGRMGLRGRDGLLTLEKRLASLGDPGAPQLRGAVARALATLQTQPLAATVDEPAGPDGFLWALAALGLGGASLLCGVFGARRAALLLVPVALAGAGMSRVGLRAEPPPPTVPDLQAERAVAAGAFADSLGLYLEREAPRGRPPFAARWCAAAIELGTAFNDLAEWYRPGVLFETWMPDRETVVVRVADELEVAFSCLLLDGRVFLTERLDVVPPASEAPAAAATREESPAPVMALASLVLCGLSILMCVRVPAELRRRRKAAAPAKRAPAKPVAASSLGSAVANIGRLLEKHDESARVVLADITSPTHTETGHLQRTTRAARETGRLMRPADPTPGRDATKHLTRPGAKSTARLQITAPSERPTTRRSPFPLPDGRQGAAVPSAEAEPSLADEPLRPAGKEPGDERAAEERAPEERGPTYMRPAARQRNPDGPSYMRPARPVEDKKRAGFMRPVAKGRPPRQPGTRPGTHLRPSRKKRPGEDGET